MKRIIIYGVVLLLGLSSAAAQKYAFVDTEYILNRIPSYTAAQEKLDNMSEEWQQEVEALFAEVEKMYKDFQTERILLTEEMRNKREEEIVARETEAKDLQRKYFGREGLMYEKRKELIKPIQDEVYKAVKEIAVDGNFAVIFDTSSGANMLYTNPKYDMSDDVLEKLGYKN
jgi:outer membrane protein